MEATFLDDIELKVRDFSLSNAPIGEVRKMIDDIMLVEFPDHGIQTISIDSANIELIF